MARYTGPSCRLCRREGVKLFLKGTRCTSEKCALNKRAFPPGQHGKNRIKLSDYAVQLREKQKVRRIYGLTEKQFRLYFKKAEKSKGVTGTALLQSLERRLDSVVLNLGFALSRQQARQIVKHKFLLVNTKPVDVPSFLVKPSDIITIKNDEGKMKLIKELLKVTKDKMIPDWIALDKEKLEAKVMRVPRREEIPYPIREQLIIELYSK
ncbi:MAG: 30S ribosomal protein S4 [Candidatus Omnitrophota bacterium]